MEEVKIIESYEGCVAYDCDKVLYIRLAKGAMASDHTHNHEETVFLMEGEAEAVIGDKILKIKAPVRIVIPANTYHKFTALSDVIGLEIK